MDKKFRYLTNLGPGGYAFICALTALLGWAVGEPFFQEGGSVDRVGMANTFLCPTITGLVAAALIILDSAARKSAAESFCIGFFGFGVVFVASFFLMIPAQIVFTWFGSVGHTTPSFNRELEIMSVLAGRAVSWCTFSAGMIAMLMVHRRTGMFISMVGASLLSGTLSGLLFDPTQTLLSGGTPWVSRLVCFSAFGGLVGFFFGMARGSSRNGMLLLTSGSLAGTRLILDSGPCLLGPSPKCDLIVDDHNVRDFSALIQRVGFGFRFYTLDKSSNCTVNSRRITSSKLRAGDRLNIGEVNMVFSYEK